MDPVTIGAVVLAIVSGAAGEAGARLWDGLRRLVRQRITDHPVGVAQTSEMAELVALEQAPNSQPHAVALAEALLARADADPDFRQGLEAWWTQASQGRVESGRVTSNITGGTQYGPVLQGRDFTGLTFHTNPPPQPPEK